MNTHSDLLPVTDLYVSAFLLCRGEKYHHLQRTLENGRRRVVFFFHSEVQETIDDYFNGGQCSAISFRNAIENCKSLIFDFE